MPATLPAGPTTLPCVPLRVIRELYGWSQKDVATRMAEHGVMVRGSGTISNIESGGRPVSKRTLRAMALALGLHPADVKVMIPADAITESAADAA